MAICESRGAPGASWGNLVTSLVAQGSPIPVVSTCSRCSTAWIKDSVPIARPAARCKAARAAPARMLLVPAGHTGCQA